MAERALISGEQMQMKVLPAFAMDKVVNLNDLNDVEIDYESLIDGETLSWDTATGKWVAPAVNES